MSKKIIVVALVSITLFFTSVYAFDLFNWQTLTFKADKVLTILNLSPANQCTGGTATASNCNYGTTAECSADPCCRWYLGTCFKKDCSLMNNKPENCVYCGCIYECDDTITTTIPIRLDASNGGKFIARQTCHIIKT